MPDVRYALNVPLLASQGHIYRNISKQTGPDQLYCEVTNRQTTFYVAEMPRKNASIAIGNTWHHVDPPPARNRFPRRISSNKNDQLFSTFQPYFRHL